VSRALLLTAVLVVAACTEGVVTPPPDVPPSRKADAPAPTAPAGDPLGSRPQLGAAKPFQPPTPQVTKTAKGTNVWLVERHALPMVSVTVAVPYGSAQDPEDKPGLAHIAADMLDEGAGKRNAVELSSAINDLGASLSIGVTADGSFVTLTVLKKNFRPALDILADVVARPRFDPKEWKRVSTLWQNGLKKRADDPASVSRVVTGAALYGPGTPYGHPSDGLLRGARKIDLAGAKAFYEKHWRPEAATVVVAGDVTGDELTQALDAALGGWAPTGAAPAPPAKPQTAPSKNAPKLVLVDRKDAPQSVVAVVRPGVSASDPKAPLLDLINTALGGSFTSRLNQNLREDRGWTYGARSAFTEVRGEGAFVARAAVHTEVTGPALKEMISELEKMADKGLSADELKKVQAQDRGELVQTYETVSGVSGRLGTLALLGVPPSWDATASAARQKATLQQLGELARAHVGTKGASVVVVGPRDKVAPQLAQLGLGEPELWDAEGTPLKK
jgi:predicted Zn-dependent peptidase